MPETPLRPRTFMLMMAGMMFFAALIGITASRTTRLIFAAAGLPFLLFGLIGFAMRLRERRAFQRFVERTKPVLMQFYKENKCKLVEPDALLPGAWRAGDVRFRAFPIEKNEEGAALDFKFTYSDELSAEILIVGEEIEEPSDELDECDIPELTDTIACYSDSPEELNDLFDEGLRTDLERLAPLTDGFTLKNGELVVFPPEATASSPERLRELVDVCYAIGYRMPAK